MERHGDGGRGREMELKGREGEQRG